ncbi:MAG TPA: hypothetical protein EYH09_02140 [Candidatus Nanopusillus sp.]|nr:hypothetical protein [Candidatus Nanopusillus sp.]HIP90294.1 hypothetical protein [Candidatus Nanopusillus sp.]
MDKKRRSIILAIVLTLSIIFSYLGYSSIVGDSSQNEMKVAYQVAETCRQLCLYAKDILSQQNRSLSSECLSEIPSLITYWHYSDWVCDVVHVPRSPEDNLPENQCKKFRKGLVKNFVEVDQNCTIVRIYYNGYFIEDITS